MLQRDGACADVHCALQPPDPIGYANRQPPYRKDGQLLAGAPLALSAGASIRLSRRVVRHPSTQYRQRLERQFQQWQRQQRQ